MKIQKLDEALAASEAMALEFKGAIAQYIEQFNKGQGMFRGERNTYAAFEGYQDFEEKNKYVPVVTTVDEKLAYFEKKHGPYIDIVLGQECTNASGGTFVDLIVEEENWGKVSSNEILRMLNLLNNFKLEEMYSRIPTRTESEIWVKSTDAEHINRNIWQTELINSIKRQGEEEQYVLAPANEHQPVPVVATRKIVRDIGKESRQKFSGEWSHVARAGVLARLSVLKTALKIALSRANKAELKQSAVTAQKIFGYLHYNNK